MPDVFFSCLFNQHFYWCFRPGNVSYGDARVYGLIKDHGHARYDYTLMGRTNGQSNSSELGTLFLGTERLFLICGRVTHIEPNMT